MEDDKPTKILKDPSIYPEQRRAMRAALGGKMTKDVYQIYSKQGFDVDDFPDCWAFGKITPYTLNQNANFVFVEVEKANVHELAGYVHYYATFKAKNKDDVDCMAQTFQAWVSQPPAKVDVVEVKFFRLKPKPGQGK